MSARSFHLVRKKQGNILVVTEPTKTIVKLHGHAVATLDRLTGLITLNSCGYKTRTTLTAMNRFLFLFNIDDRIFQRRGEWHVAMNGITTDAWPFIENYQVRAMPPASDDVPFDDSGCVEWQESGKEEKSNYEKYLNTTEKIS